MRKVENGFIMAVTMTPDPGQSDSDVLRDIAAFLENEGLTLIGMKKTEERATEFRFRVRRGRES